MTSYYKLAQIYRGMHDAAAAQDAMQNFLRLKADAQQRHDKRAAEIVRERAELPVSDPEMSTVAESQPRK